MKLLFLSVIVFLCSIFLPVGVHATTTDQEIISWLHHEGLTKYSSLSEFRPTSHVARGEVAKFMVQFALLMNKPKVKNASECMFSDIADYDPSLTEYIIQSCEYGIFKGSQGKFFPQNSISKAEALAVVMRIGYGMIDEKITPWFYNYNLKAYKLGLTNIDGRDYVRYSDGTGYEPLDAYTIPFDRMSVGRWIYELHSLKDTLFMKRKGGENSLYTYNLTKTQKILDGIGEPCDEINYTNGFDRQYILSYECADKKLYPLYTLFINALMNQKYTEAAELMNKQSMFPGFFSSTSISVYYIPFHKGILGFHISGNGDSAYALMYITIEGNQLVLLKSDHYMFPIIGESLNNAIGSATDTIYIRRNESNSLDIFKFTDKYTDVSFNNCREKYSGENRTGEEYGIDLSCFNTHLANTLKNKDLDKETQSRISAFKQKILKVQK